MVIDRARELRLAVIHLASSVTAETYAADDLAGAMTKRLRAAANVRLRAAALLRDHAERQVRSLTAEIEWLRLHPEG